MNKLGTFSLIDGLTAPEIISDIFDFIILDSEHGLENQLEQKARFLACSNASEVFVRVPTISQIEIQRYFEIGVRNIMVPQVQTIEDVKSIIDFSFFPPKGIRGVSPFTRQFNYNQEDLELKKRQINEEIKICLLVEGKTGISNLNEILSNFSKDIYMIYFGLYDFANSMGLDADLENDVIVESICEIVSLCHTHDLFVGTIATSKSNIRKLCKMGIDYIVYKNDTEILRDGLKDALS
tara:strand:- start:38316 stop:39029 length:714 start_codon:yes stop_codon:yes gene_type:complete